MKSGLISGVKRWFGKSSAHVDVAELDLRPAEAFFAVGDIHGCPDLMDRLMRLFQEVTQGQEKVIFVGDYVDRGPGSQKVLNALFEMQQLHPEQTICLMGNHERMMLDFIDDPAGRGAGWLRHGGLETLASFGVSLRKSSTDTDTAVAVADALEAALPAGLQDWMRALPRRWSSGNVHCVHAALSPRRSVEDQREEVLLWGHPDFMTVPRDDGQFVVHGHTIVPRAAEAQGRISIDTGAYRTGRLSGVRIDHGVCRFLTT